MNTAKRTAAARARRSRVARLPAPGARLLLLAPVLAGLLAPVLAALTATAAHAAPGETSSIFLESQSPAVVQANGTLSLTLRISSTIPADQLGLRISIYTPVANVSTFSAPLAAESPYLTLPAGGALLPIAGASLPPNGTTSVVSVALANRRGRAPTTVVAPLGSSATYGDFPLVIALVERDPPVTLASLSTHLVYVAHPAAGRPLGVALVLPVGTGIELTPDRTAALTTSEVTALGMLIGALNSHQQIPVSLEVYPQLLLALGGAKNLRPAAARLTALQSLVKSREQAGSVELLRTGVSALSPSAFSAAGLDSELGAQFSRSDTLLHDDFLLHTTDAPFVANDAVTPAALAELRALGVTRIVLPAEDVTLDNADLQTAPFTLAPSASKITPTNSASALIAAPALGEDLEHPGPDPALAANDLLAELAQIDFDNPYGAQSRGVVVTPEALPGSPPKLKALLGALLSGLSSDPILSATTLSGLFSGVAIGADGNAATGTLTPHGSWGALPGKMIRAARSDLAIYQGVDAGDVQRQARLEDAILLAEGAGLDGAERAAFTAPARTLLGEFGASLSIPSGRSITFTARTGEIPVTIKTTWPVPAHSSLNVLLRLSSSEDALAFPGTTNRTEAVSLSRTDTTATIKVTTRTSGAFSLALELLSPNGQVVLLRPTSFSVRSTAISGVAIGLSIGAVLVLLAWWLRSIRRGRHQRRAGSPAPLHLAHAQDGIEVGQRD